MKKLLIFDGNSIMNRAFYGVRPLSNKEGLQTNAIYGFVTIVKKHMDRLKPDYAAVAFDVREPTFRHKYYDGYKATRSPMKEELSVQVPYIHRVSELLGLNVIMTPGFEADDILGTAAANANRGGVQAFIVTGDRDSFQLVSDMTTVILAATAGDESITPEVIREKYSLSPEQLIDVKAIAGDTSDNIPGVRGIGEKGAVKLIGETGSLDALYDGLNDMKLSDSLRRKLTEAGEDPARRALHLIETTDGGSMYTDEQGRCWRVYDFITDALTRDRVETAEQFRQVGAAFGEFQKMLFDFPAAELYETIPSFHDTRKRFETFRQAVATDRAGRVKDLAREISFFLNREEMMSSIVAAIERGEYRTMRETYSSVREAHPEFYTDNTVESTLSVRVTITHADGRVETLSAERPEAQRFTFACGYDAESDTVSVYLMPAEDGAIPDAVVGKDLSAPDERTVSVGYDADLRAVEAVIADALPAMFEENRSVFLDVPQYIGVEELGESGVVLKFIVSATEENVFAARRALNRSLKLLFDEKGIDIPYPQLTVHTK